MTEQAAPSGVKLPAGVRAQVEEANRLIAELNAPPAGAPGNPGSSGTPGSPGTPGTVSSPGNPGLRPDLAARAAPPPPPPVPDAEERARTAEARYATLQGKYNAETAAMRSQLEQTNQLVGQLLERQAPAAAPAAPASQQTPEDYLKSIGATDQDIKDYGELLPIIVRLAQNMYRPTIDKLQGEIQQLRGAANTNSQQLAVTRRESIFQALDVAVPAWRAINESTEFLDWLKVHDIFAGVSRQVALSSAFKNLDQARVVAIFEAYAREYPELARAPNAPIVDPGTLLAPETRGDQPPAAPEGSGSKKIWSEAEIRNFYTRVRKKQVSKEAYQQFQAEIAQATAEGRVRPDRVDFHANSR
jgi:hypothetical protein